MSPDEPATTDPDGLPSRRARLVELLRRTDRPVLVPHIAPGGDAFGPALADGLALRTLGARPRASVGEEPATVPARQVWDTVPMDALQLQGPALARATLDLGAAGGLGLVWTAVPEDDRRLLGLSLDAVEGVIDLVRKTAEAEVACVLKQDDDATWKVSLRSKGRIDVAGVAVSLGGGGHRYAAGFTSKDRVEDTLRLVRDLLDDAPHPAVPELP